MAALLVAMAVMAVVMSMALPVWHTMAQREKEEELIFRGEQYARAIALYQRQFPGAVPPTIQVLLDEHLLRKKYKDPITNDDFQVVGPADSIATTTVAGGAAGSTTAGASPATARTATAAPGPAPVPPSSGQPTTGVAGPGSAAGGVVGVVSKSKGTALRVYNGRTHYDEWVFVATAQSNRAGGPGGTNQPGAGGARGGAAGAGGRGGPPPAGRFGAPPGGGIGPVRPPAGGPGRF